MNLPRGTLVLVDLEPTLGLAVNDNQRFPLIAVVPVTGTPAQGALYPRLAAGPSGLIKPSTALVDQVRSIDKQRIRQRFGQVSTAELEAIDAGLCLYLGLDPEA